MKYSLSYLFLNSVPLEGTTPTAWSASKGLFEYLYIDALVISITKLKRVFFWRFLRILLEVHYISSLDRLEKVPLDKSIYLAAVTKGGGEI